MKKYYQYIMDTKIVAVLFFILIGFGIGKIPIGNKEERIIPQRPFIVIGYEPYEFQLANAAVKYKILDGAGNVFYINEQINYGKSPRYSLGDTIQTNK